MELRRSERKSKDELAMEKRPLVPSCFLTPETPGSRTIYAKETQPQEWSPSSTFLTPPSSQEGLSYDDLLSTEISDLPKLDYGIGDDEQSKRSVETQRSPLLPVDRIIGIQKKMEKVDVISELLAINCGQICLKICSYLKGNDLCRFTSVCTAWRMFVARESIIHERWKAHIKECKEYCTLKGKENMGLSKGLSTSGSSDRTPLTSLNHNKQEDKIEKPPLLSTAALCSSTNHLRPCPKCSSPSQTHPGQCQCQRCGLRFCSKCLRQMDIHDSTKCQGLPLGEAQIKKTQRSRKASENTVGSKKSRDRIRRL